MPLTSTKYLGIIVDQNLNWKAQQVHMVGKGINWAAQIKRLARPSWGITPKYARRLFISIALPQILYTADVWCLAERGERSRTSKIGPTKALDSIVTIQRASALAITGGLRMSATDSLNTHAHLLPTMLTVRKWCHHALTRIAMLPKEHPLHKIISN